MRVIDRAAASRPGTIRTAARLVLGLALLLAPLTIAGQGRPAPKTIQVADGVFLFITAPYGDVGLDGNAIAIVGRDGVLVFDSNGTPASAALVLADIRRLTPAPVRYVVNSHWHWDHWYGTEVYQQAFPGVRIVAHEKTRAMMMGPALAFNKPGIETQLPAYLQRLERKIAATEAADPASPDLPNLRSLIAADRFFVAQKTGVHLAFPNVTYTDRLDVYLGGRHVEVLHYDRAVTPGDTFLYLPDEKVLVTGDLLVNPVSFALSSFPTGWLRTLERMDALDVSIIVPGHGEPLRTKELLHAHIDVFRELLRRGREAKAKGLTPDQAKAAILPGLHDAMVKMTHDDPKLNEDFRVYLVDWYLHRVYDELNGPLGDEIAPIPPA
jgi:glyoxylase-like metal-dependent hydrolase (beta-lactamase superfamily II)